MTSPSQQKLRVVGPTVVTANRLSDGKVLYRAADEGWTTRLEAAAVVTTTEAARELLPAAVREDTEAVDAYAAPVAICDGCIEPRNLRERIRAAGRHSRCQQRGNRIAIPCGTLSSAQLHTFARIARKYDRKYSHFTTRQNWERPSKRSSSERTPFGP